MHAWHACVRFWKRRPFVSQVPPALSVPPEANGRPEGALPDVVPLGAEPPPAPALHARSEKANTAKPMKRMADLRSKKRRPLRRAYFSNRHEREWVAQIRQRVVR